MTFVTKQEVIQNPYLQRHLCYLLPAANAAQGLWPLQLFQILNIA